ncbi:MAG TPA: SH3 domain-containing protein [Bdellovibrionales bacterium]|nr:SH3 domain-containing protein [Bdellovibrionales bacterium]
MARYMPFLRVDRKAGWVKVQDLEGESHWAKASDITNKFRCLVVKSNVATLRAEPAKDAAMMDLKKVDKNKPVKRLENNREWIQVEDETGRRSWIHESNVWKPVRVQSISF